MQKNLFEKVWPKVISRYPIPDDLRLSFFGTSAMNEQEDLFSQLREVFVSVLSQLLKEEQIAQVTAQQLVLQIQDLKNNLQNFSW